MNNLSESLKCVLFAVLAVFLAAEAVADPIGDNPLLLWYDRPAKQWTEALPIGNGRFGAMIFGGVNQERLQLNEGTLWAGGPYDPVNPEAKDGAASSPTVDKRGQVPGSCRAHQRKGHGEAARPDAVSNRWQSAPNISWHDEC